MVRDAIAESAAQWEAAWRHMTAGSPAFEKGSLPGVAAYWANVAMPVYNHAVLTSPVDSVDDLRTRVDAVLDFARERSSPWMFSPCEAWLPDGAHELLAALGLTLAMQLTGMATDRLTDSPVNAGLDIRPLSGREGSRLIGDLNCAAYGMPMEWSAETDWESFFGDNVFSCALYDGGVPASTATVLLLDGCLNVVSVATPAPFQRRGYAEAVVRWCVEKAVAATGVSRTLLHASRAGYPLYLRLGYQPVAEFTAWSPAPEIYSHSA